MNGLIVMRGGGDLASGAAFRLHRAGLRVIVLELDAPLLVRRVVCYGDAVFDGVRSVDGVTARRIDHIDRAETVLDADEIPVWVDAAGESVRTLRPLVVVDARMEKRPLDSTIHDAPLVIALGPGYTAGIHAHAVIETNRGHHLGRVYWQGSAEPDTGEPGSMAGKTHSRVLRAPAPGHVTAHVSIGDTIHVGQIIADVGGIPLIAPFDGVLRGLVHPAVAVQPGMKIGDLDPRSERDHCFTISDKALAVGGGVLEAVLTEPHIRSQLYGGAHERG
ncbi:MAG: selenium-dependent molybdenum cofactor biosynthesis protein YqeB [bacterium]|nr:selenium-dependent molybdenum cofactor biosynthesis protein YqeB [bacterium]